MVGAEFADAAGKDVGRAGEAGSGLSAWLGVEAGRGAGLENLAIGEKEQMVGLECHCRAAGCEDDRAAGLGGVAEMADDGRAGGVIEGHAGFVDQQDAALGDETGGGEGKLRLAVGEMGWRGFG